MPKLREFDDIDAVRSNIYSRVLASVQKKYAGMENDRYRIELTDLRYDDKLPTMEDQKKALLSRRSVDRKLHGKWRMIDKATGKVVDEKAGVVAHVPHYTERGTFIYNGNEYTIANQMRLRPGVYTRRKDNGELEAHVNTLPGSGRPFRLHMEPETGIFKMQVGQAHIPFYPFLRQMGVSDAQIEKAWGKDILNANRQKLDEQAVSKVYSRMLGHKPDDGDPVTELRSYFDSMRMDPDVVQNNLGGFYDMDKQADETDTFNYVPIPDVEQGTQWSCGASAMQAVLAYFGRLYEEEDLVDLLNTDESDGTSVKDMVRVARMMGLETICGRMTVDDVLLALSRGVPVILNIQDGKSDGNYEGEYDYGHFVVAIGSDDEGLIVEDPQFEGERGHITFSDLESRWHAKAGDIILDHFGLAIYPKHHIEPPKTQSVDVKNT